MPRWCSTASAPDAVIPQKQRGGHAYEAASNNQNRDFKVGHIGKRSIQEVCYCSEQMSGVKKGASPATVVMTIGHSTRPVKGVHPPSESAPGADDWSMCAPSRVRGTIRSSTEANYRLPCIPPAFITVTCPDWVASGMRAAIPSTPDGITPASVASPIICRRPSSGKSGRVDKTCEVGAGCNYVRRSRSLALSSLPDSRCVVGAGN